MLKYAEPVAEAGAMTLINHHEIEEVRIVVFIDLFAIQLLIERLVIGEKHLADQVLPIGNGFLVDGDALIRREGGEGAVGLILEAVAVGEKQYVLPLESIAVHHFPNELEDNKGLTGTSGHEQQCPGSPLRELPKGLGNRHLLIGTNRLAGDLVDVVSRRE